MRIDQRFVWQSDTGLQVEMAPELELSVEDATGIDGLKNEIYTSKTAGQDGVTETGDSLPARNITLTGSIHGSAVLAWRTRLLAAFTPKAKGTLQYMDALRTHSIRASVEQAPTFSDNEVEPCFFLSLLCPLPYWEDVSGATRNQLAAWEPLFEFPFELNDVIGIRFEERQPSIIINIHNAGHVAAGMQVLFTATGEVRNPEIMHMGTREKILLNTTMWAGESICVDTRYGKKGVHYTNQNGVTVAAFQLLDMDSTFIWLAAGDNLIRYGATLGIDALNVDIIHSPYYLGV